ncbi:GDP-mannose 4,6-dehydratase [Nocardioides euryhalodurans]|uniref:GDP-mannose 4,6-dehydratase n=1 Tax=Nocardioides euryhalodurans TaxID=2518370 RepID=A0A4P7GNR6_9ACTN|nr:GDP-mannose 4,6-dehydratase [Nocardioides euryhalodurans]QBR93411.1 GDP-mannose 4,6-dehydratase [Nocardioides euryhalodurans]
MRALVTGVGGQDGRYLVDRLLAEGTEVHGFAHEAEPRPDLPGVEVHLGDLTRHDDVRRLVLDVAPDEIYNLAAVSSVARSWQEPDLVAAVNGDAAVALLETALQVQQRSGREVRFVQASSAEIFGEPGSEPQTERTPLRPVNPYGEAKAAAHRACATHRRRGLHAASLVLYSHESPRRPPGFVTRRITSTVAAIARGEADELVLGNLEARRDWGWAPDYVDAMVRAARADRPDDFVVATGVAHSVRDFVAAAFRHAGVPDPEAHLRVDGSRLRPRDAGVQVGDATRARTVLGWQPTVAFDELVRRMVEADLSEGGGAGRAGSRRTRSS